MVLRVFSWFCLHGFCSVLVCEVGDDLLCASLNKSFWEYVFKNILGFWLRLGFERAAPGPVEVLMMFYYYYYCFFFVVSVCVWVLKNV